VEQPLGDGDESSADPHEPARALRGVGPLLLLFFLDPPSPFFLGSTVAGRATSFAVRGTVVRWTPAARLALDTTLLRTAAPRLALDAVILRLAAPSLVLSSTVLRCDPPLADRRAEAAVSVPGSAVLGTARWSVCRGMTTWRPSCFTLGRGRALPVAILDRFPIGFVRLRIARSGGGVLGLLVPPALLPLRRAGNREQREAQDRAPEQTCGGRAGPWRHVVHRQRQKM
jgi:hypothetical protein